MNRKDNSDFFYKNFVGNENIKRYVYGVNEYSEAIAKFVDLDGFIDDYTNSKFFLGKPVYKLKDISPEAWVVSCVTNARPITALNNLNEAGIRHFVDYFSFADASDGRLPNVSAIEDTRKDYQSNENKYNLIRSKLFDDESRVVFDDIIGFRRGANIELMNKYKYAADRQYFEEFLPLLDGEVFVDGGGYDGFTSIEFEKRCPRYRAIHFFEPSEATLENAKNNLKEYKNIIFHQLGLFSDRAVLKFDSGSGSASKISESGTVEISVDSLDNVVHDRISFVKLDLEGAELSALEGMKSHITNDHPKIAVAVYHHPSDFWKIPEYILSIRNDYDIYLRHYTESWTETVMYFVPV